jgi:hypothetical protein
MVVINRITSYEGVAETNIMLDLIWKNIPDARVYKKQGAFPRSSKAQDYLYEEFDATFDFINYKDKNEDEKPAEVSLTMANPATEWIIANILVGNDDVINFNDRRLKSISELINFVERKLFVPQLTGVFLDSYQFLTNKKEKVTIEQKTKLSKIIKDIDSKIIYKNNKVQNYLYNKLHATITITNEPRPIIKFNMANAETEWMIANIISGNKDIINFKDERLKPLKQLINFVENQIYKPQIMEGFLESVKYLTTKRFYKRGRPKKGQEGKIVLKIVNPTTKRVIDVNKSTYKKLFGKIILKRVEYKDLSTYDQIKYKIDSNCAISLLTLYEEIPIEKIEEILGRTVNEDIEIDELIKVYNSINITIRMYDDLQMVYYEDSINTCDRIFKIYEDHIYLLSTDKINKKYTSRLIKSIDDIDKYKNNTLITENLDLFKEIRKKIKENHILIEYNGHELVYKTNKISFDPFYSLDKEILDKFESKKSVHNMIEEKLRLTGYMNDETYKTFYSCTKIRSKQTDIKEKVLLDLNGAYPAQLLKKDIVYGIPDINNYWEIYNNEKLVEHGSYYCIVKKTDSFISPTTESILSYYEVIELKKYDQIEEIKYMFIPGSLRKFTEYEYKFLDFMITKPYRQRLRTYIGWLAKHHSVITKQYEIEDPKNYKALEYYYGWELKISNSNRYKFMSLNKEYTRKQTGLLSNMLIEALTNIELFRMDKLMHQLNQNIVISSIKTDSLGYYSNDDIKLPEDKMSSDYGLWKDELDDKKKKTYFVNREFRKDCIKPTVIDENINNYTIEDLDNLLVNNQHFLLHGDYGTGKSYSIKHMIIPKLKKLNKTYLVASLTNDNSKKIDGVTIASIFNNRSDCEIFTKMKQYDYLIIDECQQMNQEILKELDILKINLPNIKIILIGDYQQTKGNGIYKNFEESKFIMKLCDYNCLRMVINYRCEKRLVDLVEEVKKQSIRDMTKYTINNFQNTTDINNFKFHLCRFKKTQKNLSDNNLECELIIKNQGSTIEQDYLIHDIKFLPKDHLITALTRARKWENIYLNV